MKTLISKLIVILSILFFAISAYAVHDVKIEANWAWNGTDQTTIGFKFYLDGNMVQDIPDATARTKEWTLPLENGKHLFSMTAYGPDWESVHSPEYPFEYLYVDQDGRPSPMVIIRIN